MTHRIMFPVVMFAALISTCALAPTSASAQHRDAGADAGVADAGTPDSGATPFCTSGHVLGCVCPDGQHENASGVCVPNVPRAAQLGYCIMPDGSGVADDGAHRCGCPEGTLPFAVERHRSVDRLRSLGVPRGYAVFACANPMAMHGSPDSVEARTVTLPTDLGPLIRQVENLASALEAEHRLVEQLVTDSRTHAAGIADNATRTELLSSRLDALSQCLQYGVGRAVTYTENGVSRTYTCREFLAANRQQAATETHHVTGEDSRAFVLAQAFADLGFTQLSYGDTDYGLPWSVGVELTLGIPIGGVWHIQFGGGLGAAFPKVPGVTNVSVMPSVGFGVTKPINRNVHFTFGFGGLASLRFQPDGHLAHNVYAPYVEGLFRFGARSAWSPVLGFRLYAGVAPRFVPNGTFEVPFTAGGIVTFGFGHF